MKKRYEELDSLRGLAALTVLFGHLLAVFNESSLSNFLFKFGPLKGLVSGSEAVILFFILSGFVLSLPFYADKKIHYGSYLIKRICRIYIPYVLTIFIAILCRNLFYSGEISGLSDWMNTLWSKDISVKDMLNYLLLIGNYSGNINYVVWSLVHEMRISLIFPFLMLFVLRANYKQGIAVAFLISFFSVAYVFATSAYFNQTEWFSTVNYTSLFIIGALIAKYRENIIAVISKIKTKNKIFLLIVGLVFFIYGHPSFAIRVLFRNFDTFSFYGTVIDSWAISVGAVIIVVLSLSSARLSKTLHIGLFTFLGKISYSLYLTHLIVLASLIHVLHGRLSMLGIIFIALVCSLIVASIFYYSVEKSSMRLGKFLASKVEGKVIPNEKNKAAL